MRGRWADMEVIAGLLTALPAEITGAVNVESVVARGKSFEIGVDADTGGCIREENFALNKTGVEHGNSIRHSTMGI